MTKLFEKNMIGNVEIKNRLGMSPMGFTQLESGGIISDRQIDYYVERAKGGYGLIYPPAIRSCTKFEPHAHLALENVDQAVKFSILCDKVHQHGGKICMQLSPGIGRINFPSFGHVVKSASAVPIFWDPNIKCEPYTVEEIKFFVDAFGKSALLAQQAGVDIIEIHAYGGYLIDQFISECWNKREDEYGGSRENRLRLVFELRDAVRKYCGDQIPIIVKVTPEHGFEGGRKLEEGIEILKLLDNAGFAAIHLDYGCYETWYNAVTTVYQEKGNQLFIAEAARKAGITSPLIVQGKLDDPELAEKVVSSGTADFVLHGHPSLADPYWPQKALQGRYEDIRHCIGCNECLRTIFGGNTHFTCSVNPLCGMEKDYVLAPAQEKKSILIVGGGPAGMMAAITAAERGFKAEIWEKEAQLGGALVAAAAPEFKLSVKQYLEYLKVQIYKNNVKVRLGKEATAEDILWQRPDVVILAGGSNPIIPKIDGKDSLSTVEATELLKTGKCLGEKVVVLGGGLVGCEVALQLSNCGKDVTIVEMMDDILKTVVHCLNNDLALRKLIAESDIKLITGARMTAAGKEGVVVQQDGKTMTIPCDTLVLAVGYKSNQDLESALVGKIEQVFTIGDNVKPAKVLDAVSQGYHTVRLL